MLTEEEINQLWERFFSHHKGKGVCNRDRRYRQMVGSVVNVVKKVYGTAHPDLPEKEISKFTLAEKFNENENQKLKFNKYKKELK